METHQSRERQTISEPSHRRPKVARMEILVQVLALHSRKQISPHKRNTAPRDPSSLVRDLDGDVLFSLDDDDLDWREGPFGFGAVALDDGTERVFEELEEDVGKMAGDIGEVQVWGADELNWRSFEKGVMLFADKACVFDCFVGNVMDVLE